MPICASVSGTYSEYRSRALPDARLTALDPFFVARNSIVHQLDYTDPAGTGTGRHHRAPADVVAQCDQVLLLASDLIVKTASLLR